MKDITPPPPDRYDRMTYRRCGNTGLKLPLISVGAAFGTLAGKVGLDATRRLVNTAFDQGVTHFDLANNYGNPPGNAEKVFGRILQDLPREEAIVSTKAGFRGWPGPYGIGLSRKSLIESCERSLRRLKIDHVDLFYAHAPDDETSIEETLETLDLLVRQGKALYTAIANQDAAGVDAIRHHQQSHNLLPLALHQTPYNVLARGAEAQILPQTAAAGMGAIAFYVLGQGVLSGKYRNGNIPEGSRIDELWTEDEKAVCLSPNVLSQVEKLSALAAKRGQTLAQLCIAWVLNNPHVTSVVLGVTSEKQLFENLGALKHLEFSEDELRTIDEISPPPQ